MLSIFDIFKTTLRIFWLIFFCLSRKSRYIFTKVFKSLIDKETEDSSLYFAVWYLYRGYVEKEDDLELGVILAFFI